MAKSLFFFIVGVTILIPSVLVNGQNSQGNNTAYDPCNMVNACKPQGQLDYCEKCVETNVREGLNCTFIVAQPGGSLCSRVTPTQTEGIISVSQTVGDCVRNIPSPTTTSPPVTTTTNRYVPSTTTTSTLNPSPTHCNCDCTCA